MRLFHGMVVANSMIRLALNPPAAWIRQQRINPAVTTAVRTFSKNRVGLSRVIGYEEVKKGIEKQSLVIDVRNHHEVVATGKIPTSINIPLDHVKTALSLSDPEFQSVYNVLKPDKKRQIIFYCKSGNRAMEAAIRAHKLGYLQSKAYAGSWEDWEVKHKVQIAKDKQDPCSS